MPAESSKPKQKAAAGRQSNAAAPKTAPKKPRKSSASAAGPKEPKPVKKEPKTKIQQATSATAPKTSELLRRKPTAKSTGVATVASSALKKEPKSATAVKGSKLVTKEPKTSAASEPTKRKLTLKPSEASEPAKNTAIPQVPPSIPAVTPLQQESSEQEKRTRSSWSISSCGKYELCVVENAAGNEVVRCIANGIPRWEHTQCYPVHGLQADDQFVAIHSEHEFSVVSLATGLYCISPSLLDGPVLQMEINAGFLVALFSDASLTVWDLNQIERCAKTTLRHVCTPSEIETLSVKRSSGEPFVRLTDGQIKLYRKDLEVWVTLRDVQSQNSAAMLSDQASTKSRELPRLENDMLMAACRGDPEYFKVRLKVLTRRCLDFGGNDLHRLQDWCSILIDGKTDAGFSMKWLADEVLAMGLDGSSLISNNVLPSIGDPGCFLPVSDAAQQLRQKLIEQLKVLRI